MLSAGVGLMALIISPGSLSASTTLTSVTRVVWAGGHPHHLQTDDDFFIEILILVPATPPSINNQTQLRMSNVEIFIRFIPKQLKIVSIDVV